MVLGEKHGTNYLPYTTEQEKYNTIRLIKIYFTSLDFYYGY